MTSKGVFTNPKSLGEFSEIALISAQIRRLDRLENNGTYEISSTMGEGEERKDGVFLSRSEETFHLDVQEFSGPDKTIVRNFFKLLIRKYAKYKKYSGLTVS